jgi:hypothetical protein
MSTFRTNRWGPRDPRAVRRLEARAAIARLVLVAGTVVFLVIAAGILLVVLGANQDNDVAAVVLDAARWLAGPFDGLFDMGSHKAEIAVNWGIAAVVYAAIARLLAHVLLR